jgi:mycothiol synthase
MTAFGGSVRVGTHTGELFDLRPDFRIRPLLEGDTDAIVRLYDAASARDAKIGPIAPAQWTSFIGSPQNQDGQDFRVVLHNGRLVGLAESSLRDQNGRKVRFFKLLVEPSMCRQGVGSALLRELFALNAPDDSLSFQTLAASKWTDGIAFLEELGFSRIESEINMRCSSMTTPARSPPGGVSIEQAETPPIHAEVVARIHNEALAADAAFRAYSASEMAELLAEQGQELWLIKDGSRIVGYCRLEREPKLIWLEEIGIDPSLQGQGLGTALAHHVLRTIAIDGERPAGLNVSSVNRAARSMYHRLGFVM